MDKAQKAKARDQARKTNVLESIKDLGSGVGGSIKEDLLKGVSKDFLDQILGRKQNKKASADIRAGESLEFNDLLSGKHEENLKLQHQMSLERKLASEDKERSTQKSNELKLQLQALMQEVLSLAKSTQNLGQEVEVAAMAAPAEPGVYHVIFFEKLISFIRSFRAKIDNASVWLHSSNKRAEKKHYWSMYKKHGASFLLSGEHYSQRSAG
jgi:hypothetical protein